jgi:hypothetical protein
MKRPLFVCHDLFDSSILDLAWSKVKDLKFTRDALDTDFSE